MKDNFENNIFSARVWSAPSFKCADEIKGELERLNLVGRKIKRMRMIGLSYFLTRDWIESAAYEKLPHLSEEERQLCSEYKNIAPDMEFVRSTIIDEPFLIEFEDGDVFEIDTPMDPYYRFGMNHIPWYIGAYINEPNCDADVLFSVCIGKRIEKVDVDTYKADVHQITGEALNAMVVSRIVLWLEDKIGLCIQPYIDYCEVYCVDEEGKCLLITFEDLKKGLFNREDLHDDEETGA